MTSPACDAEKSVLFRQLVSAKTCAVEGLSIGSDGRVGRRFQPGMLARVTDEEDREHETQRGVDDAEIERLGSKPVPRGHVAGRQRSQAKRAIASSLVQPHGKAATARPDQVDLHVHGHRPGEPLTDPEEHVRADDPCPRRSVCQHERHRQADDPAGHQHGLAREAVRQQARHEIHAGLDDAEGDDEREDHHLRADVELLSADERNDGALEPHHAADEGVDEDEERELREVLPQPEAHGAGHTRHGYDLSACTFTPLTPFLPER